LCSYVLSECKPRKPKELYKKKNSWVTQMKQFYMNNKGLNH
jgi:deoxyhypusine synthase